MTQLRKNGKSQASKILAYLLSGNTLTSLQAIAKFGCLRLSGRILEIRQRYKVKTETVKTKNGARIAKYSIPV